MKIFLRVQRVARTLNVKVEPFKIEYTKIPDISFKKPVTEYIKIKVTVFIKFSNNVILFKSELLYAVIKFFKKKIVIKIYKKNGFSCKFKTYDIAKIFLIKVFL